MEDVVGLTCPSRGDVLVLVGFVFGGKKSESPRALLTLKPCLCLW
jgi:hypothetical protein